MAIISQVSARGYQNLKMRPVVKELSSFARANLSTSSFRRNGFLEKPAAGDEELTAIFFGSDTADVLPGGCITRCAETDLPPGCFTSELPAGH